MYVLFAGPIHYPLGGWNDFIGVYQTVEEAEAAFAKGEYPKGPRREEFIQGFGWGDIIDVSTLTVVKTLF